MSFLIPGFTDVIDIFFVAFLIYKIIIIFKERGGFQILIGLVGVIFLYFLSTILNLNMTSSFFRFLKDYWVIAFLVLFQSEIRAFLNNLIKNSNIIFSFKQKEKLQQVYYELLSAIKIMSFKRIGALIVIERNQKLDEFIEEKAIIVDARISQKLLLTIFNKKTLMHDGAVIIRNNRIYAAKVILPNSENIELKKKHGTRHLAGLGIAEKTDSFVIIVSEETGKVSIAEDGKLESDVSYDYLSQKLKDVLSE